MPDRVIKDPAAIRTYGLALAALLEEGDTLATVAWTVPAGLTKVSEGISSADLYLDAYGWVSTSGPFGLLQPAGTVALVRLSGGTAGTLYELVCRFTTTPGGDVDERVLRVSCVDGR